jgi:peptide chain release factor 2
MAVTQC